MKHSIAFVSLILTLIPPPANAQVTIHRDKYGVPSIIAKNLPEALYGLGYAMATDNPLGVARMYKQARGRLAEIEGRGTLAQDAFLRGLGFEERAEKEAKNLPLDLLNPLNRFCAGINRALQEQKAKLPKWVEPCGIVDILAMAQALNALFPLQDAMGTLTQGTGSNQFAIAGKRSATGNAIISADPHLPLNGLIDWYEFALYTPEIAFRGVTPPGVPLGAIGHNDKVAWCVTNNDPDLWDLYQIQRNPQNQKQSNFHGEWREFENTTVEINYREGDTLKTQKQTLQRTAWGPAVPFRPLALRLSVPPPLSALRQGFKMMQAQNIAQFREALKERGLSMWNLVYADTKGDIAYQYNAYLPRKDPKIDWTKPVNGADPRTKWGELHSLDELPNAQNPASGLLVNGNSSPSLTTLGDEIPTQGWATYITSYGHTTRYDRLAELLKNATTLGTTEAKRIATDTQVPYATAVIAELNKAYATTTKDQNTPLLQEAMRVLTRWNKRADTTSRGTLLFREWVIHHQQTLALEQKTERGEPWTPADARPALNALKEVAEKVKKYFGRLDPTWGETHTTQRGEKTAPSSGYGYYYGETAAVVPNTGRLTKGRTNVQFGSSFRMIAHLKPNSVESWTALPYGESADPNSPHSTDQMAMYGRGEYKPTHFGRKNAVKYARTTQILHPDAPIPTSTLIQGATLIDGTGKPRYHADIRLENGTIRAIGKLTPTANERTIDANKLVAAPGFIDAHSHADGGIFENPSAETQIRQGITTAIVGQDGGHQFPLKRFFAQLQKTPVALNFASFIGHGTIRNHVIGKENRPATPQELAQMEQTTQEEISAGGLGLSSGLEYVPGRYAPTAEIIALARIAAKQGGIYISHVRNEDNNALEAFDELFRVGRKAKIPAQISHIKLGSAKVWEKAQNVLERMEEERKKGGDITADLYPYAYWQSTIRVLIPTEEFGNRTLWEQGLKDIGGAENVRLSTYTPDRTWEGKTLAEIAKTTGTDPISLAQAIVEKTRDGKEREGVIVTAMQEHDIIAFMRSPLVMFCSDGGLRGSHPRGAGTYPRILGRYVRELKAISLEEAIRKMTSLPASRMRLKDRGVLKVGSKADLVLFNPNTVRDAATVQNPRAQPAGIPYVFVNGILVLDNGAITDARPGTPLRPE